MGRKPAPARPLADEITFRMMTPLDLPAVYQIDSLSFEPLWQNSLDEVQRSFSQAGYCTIAEKEGQVMGYQISTLKPGHLHLTRLAVHPLLQRLSIGYGIVYHLLSFCSQQAINQVTVNTQDSIAPRWRSTGSLTLASLEMTFQFLSTHKIRRHDEQASTH